MSPTRESLSIPVENDTAKDQSARRLARGRSRRRTLVALIALGTVVLSVAFVGIYREFVSPYNTTVLIVDGTRFKMGYFLKRLSMTQKSPVTMLHQLTQEQIVREVATRPPYNLTVTSSEVDQYARRLAQGQGTTAVSDSRFKAWYKQELNQTGLSNDQYRELLRTRLLIAKMAAYLISKIPTETSQVLVNIVPVGSPSVAATVEQACNSGTNFTDLVSQYSTDPQVTQSHGRVGWFPEGVLSESLDKAAFSLPVGKCSKPIAVNSATYVVLMVSGKSSHRKIDQQSMRVLSSRAFGTWYDSEAAKHTISYRGFNGKGFDSQTSGWVENRVSIMRGAQAN